MVLHLTKKQAHAHTMYCNSFALKGALKVQSILLIIISLLQHHSKAVRSQITSVHVWEHSAVLQRGRVPPWRSLRTRHNFNHARIFSRSIPDCFGKRPTQVSEVGLRLSQPDFLIKPFYTRAVTLHSTSTATFTEILKQG